MTSQDVRLNARQFRTLIHSNADGMLVVDRRTGRVRFANPAALALLDRPVHDVVDRSFGQPVALGGATEIDVPRADGKHRVAEMRAVEIEWDGQPAWLASLRDMTERKEAEESLAREKDFVAAVLDTLGALVLVLDLGGRIVRVNPACCRLLGYGPEHLVGRDFGWLLHDGGFSPSRMAVERLQEEAGPIECQAAVRTSGGERRMVAWRITALRRRDVLRNVIVTGIDVTDLEGARRELERRNRLLSEARLAAEAASQAKSHFLATMSHEIRTPLNGILGTLELLKQRDLPPEEAELADLMHLSARGLLGLVSDVLDFSKIESGKLELAPEPFELRTRLEQVVSVLRPEAARRGLALEVQVGRNAPTALVGDWGRLQQVLINLLGNALKFTERGRVRLEVACLWNRDGQSCLRFSVEDTGIGIPPDLLPRIFEPFTQLDEPMVRRHSGTGLGLAIAAELVRTMGGRLEVESTPGAGSRFHFRVTMGLAEAPCPDEASAGDDGPAGLHILLVEDNPVNRKVAELLLEQRGWQVALASSGPEALETLRRETFDVVLLDVEMPGVSGFDVVQRLREREKAQGRHTPVVAVTAHSVAGFRERCLAAGMDHYLAKPFRADELYRVVARACSGGR